MESKSKSILKLTVGGSNLFWGAVRSQLQIDSDRALAKLLGLDQAAISRARQSLDPFHRITREKQHRLLEELTRAFEHPDALRTWLTKIGWPLSAEQGDWLNRHFRRRQNLQFLRRLTPFYEPRPALEAEIIKHLQPPTLYKQGSSHPSGIVLSGIRGQGKTTLALGALSSDPALDEKFPDGVYFLDCHRQSTDQCLMAFAAELGHDVTGLAVEQRPAALRKLAHDKSLLLVLDDVEDVATIRKFYTVLGSCDTNRLLVTTYQHWTRAELADVRLHTLDVPDLTAREGQRLTERTLRQSLTPAEQASFDRLLNRIAGQPLALSILIGLKDDTQSTWHDLLQTLEQSSLAALEYPDATDKADSVRLCFELVYQRLVEQAPVFRALGVFAGARGTVGMLCAISELTERVELTLQQLTRYHLLTIESGAAGSARIWQTHTLLHEFAALKLHEQPDEEQTYLRRYLNALLAVLRQLRLTYEQQPIAYSQLIVVRDDVLRAIRLAAQFDDFVTLSDLIDLGAELLIKAGWTEPLAALLADLSIDWGTAPAILQARLAAIGGQIELARQHPLQAYTYFEQALQFELPLSMGLEVLLMAGRVQLRLEQLAMAEELVIRASMWAALHRPHTPLEAWANVYEAQAELAMSKGDCEPALGYWARAEENYATAGWELSVARMRLNQADCLIQLNRPAEGLRLLDQARAFFNAQTWPLTYLESLAENYCFAFLRQGNYAAMQTELTQWEQTLRDTTTVAVTPNHAKLWQWRGALAEVLQDYASALAYYQQALTIWQQVPASASTQQIIQERIAAVQSHLSEEPHGADATI